MKNLTNKFQKNKSGYLGSYVEIYDAVNEKINCPLTRLDLFAANSKIIDIIKFLKGK